MTLSTSAQFRASVVVPVRNRPDLLLAAIHSLLEQDMRDGEFEIIVSDDGSTADIIGSLRTAFHGTSHKFPIHIISSPPRGPASARNSGTRIAKSDIVVFVDSDVVLDSKCICELIEAMESNRHWSGAEARLLPTGGEDGPLWDAPSSGTGGRFHTAAIAYRRDVLVLAGGFDEAFTLPACEDVEIAVRMLRYGPIGFVADALAYHPQRRITAATHLKWRHHWRYEVILAVRYGVLAFPSRTAGRFPRLRVLLCALITLPIGRILDASRYAVAAPRAFATALLYFLIDLICGILAAWTILFSSVPERRHYLSKTLDPHATEQL